MKTSKINWLAISLELVVVFLGVSAGFMLQNYNERSSEKTMERKYIEGFKEDVKANIESLKDEISTDSSWIAENYYAISLIMNGSLSKDSATSMMKSLAYISRFTPQNITYLNVTNSGNLNLIRDYDLRQQIMAYQMELEEHEILEAYYYAYHQEQFLPYFIKSFDVFSETWLSPNKYREIEFNNHYGAVFSFKRQCLEGYSRLKKLSEDLLVKLED